MKVFRLFSAAASLLAVAACANPDHVVFLTGTSIGIDSDPVAGRTNIGYDRHELVLAPAYVETGAIPPVFATLNSNLSFIRPKIRQLYATGDAAKLVTNTNTKTTECPHCNAELLTGERRMMTFGTSSSLGLNVEYPGAPAASAAPALPKLSLGYKRAEYSVIPLQENDPIEGERDTYGSVIAGLTMNVAAQKQTTAGMVLTQFIATDQAARNLASDNSIQRIFTIDAQENLKRASIDKSVLDGGLVNPNATAIKNKICTDKAVVKDPEKAGARENFAAQAGMTLENYCVGNLTVEQAKTGVDVAKRVGLIDPQ